MSAEIAGALVNPKGMTKKMTAKVAGQVGYGSEAALSAAFFRCNGTTPGAYRRQVQTRIPSNLFDR